MDDAEYERRSAALDAVLDRHIGPRITEFPEDFADVFCLMSISDGVEDAMRRGAELERLENFARAAREFVRAWDSLHIDVRETIISSAYPIAAKEGLELAKIKAKVLLAKSLEWKYAFISQPRPHPGWPDWIDLWSDVIPNLDKLIGGTLLNAKTCIDAAPEAGKRDMRAVRVIDTLREIWQQRKRTPAPNYISDAGGPFADLIAEVFEVLGVKAKPRSAMQSWKLYREAYPKT